MQRKLGLYCGCIEGEDPLVTIERIKSAGFDSTFAGKWSSDNLAKIQEKCVKIGLTLEFIHAPFRGINALWEHGVDYLPLYEGIKESIDDCANFGIEGIVLHVSSGWHPPQVSDVGLARYDALVEYAIRKGVVVAFENLRKAGNLAMMVDRYEKVDAVKFCYDCGHEHCYTETVCMPDLFRDRMIYTHIHDNFGRDCANKEADGDFHLLPFDGNIDYQKMVDKLDEYNYTGSIMLEVKNCSTTKENCPFDRKPYGEWSADEYVRECYVRAKAIAALSKK